MWLVASTPQTADHHFLSLPSHRLDWFPYLRAFIAPPVSFPTLRNSGDCGEQNGGFHKLKHAASFSSKQRRLWQIQWLSEQIDVRPPHSLRNSGDCGGVMIPLIPTLLIRLILFETAATVAWFWRGCRGHVIFRLILFETAATVAGPTERGTCLLIAASFSSKQRRLWHLGEADTS